MLQNTTMASHGSLLPRCLSSVLVLCFIFACTALDEDRDVYVVYMGSLPQVLYSPTSHHLSLLQAAIDGNDSAENLLIRSYKKSFNGFAATLTRQEAQKLADEKEVVSVFPSKTYQLQTTRSWDFIGLHETVRRHPTVESDIVIGVLDSGIWHESESFSDEGFGPPPKKWKGACNGGKNFTCNNKLVGARYYGDPGLVFSAQDGSGHGTHTASTAAGNRIKGANFYGLAQGTAKGGVPSARIAAYNVCGPPGCPDTSILAAFDDAIADGVDIITISIGPRSPPQSLLNDAIAIGSFHAMAKGVLTTQSAGNLGPFGQVTSVAPWLLTVAASTIDRKFIDKVVLGNGKTLVGSSINSFSQNGKMFPLIYGAKSSSSKCTADDARACIYGCLNKSLVEGKIIMCDSTNGNDQATALLAVGSILRSRTQYNDVAAVVPLPSLTLNLSDYTFVTSYVNSTTNPTASISKSEVAEDVTAPRVAEFSSRGPNSVAADIMKPDVTAPGVDILASYPPYLLSTNDPHGERRVKFYVLSGTSMACPHVAGAAAYVKSFHPAWSPSMIKSALMTTARFMNNTESAQDREFAYGSGHIDPVKAVHPGLVYEAYKEDYITLLCSLGYATNQVRQISGDNATACARGAEKALPRDFNYPSLTAKVDAKSGPFNIMFGRTVTNVGHSNSTYKSEVSFPASGIERITVEPQVLSFKSLKEKKSFNVTVVGKFEGGVRLSASLVWSDGPHTVRTPIIVYAS